jgi:hypothetical protein
MSDTAKGSPGARVGRGFLYGFLLFSIVVLSGGRLAFLILIPFHLLCGWLFHAWKSLPPFLAQWQEAVLPLGCLLLATVLAHRFILRWAREKRPTLTWRGRHTAAVFSLLILCSAAAIATSGIVHQFFWLAGGKVIESNRRADLTVAMSNGRQLMMALLEFEDGKGRFPHSFEELEAEAGEYSYSIRRLTWLDTGDGKAPEPWILLRPSSSEVALADEPVIVSPVIAARGMVAVGYGDSSVRAIRVEKLAEVIGQVGDGKEGR